MKSMEKLKNLKNHNHLTIYRGRIESIVIFEVLEHELDIIENGEKHRTFGKHGSNLLYFSLSLIVNWLTSDLAYEFLNFIILLGGFTGTILGIILIRIYRQDKKSVETILDRIRKRIIIK